MKPIFVIFLLFFSVLLSASDWLPSTYYAGFNISKARGFDLEYEDNQKKRTAITLGFLKGKVIHDNLLLQTGLMLSQRGTQFIYSQDDQSIEKRWFLNYIEIPILGSYQFPFKLKNINFVVKHGVVFAYLFDYRQDILTNRVVAKNVPFDIDVNKDLVDLYFSLGFIKPLQHKVFSIDLAYRLGLRGIGGDKLDIKNNAIDIVFGLQF